MLKVRCANAIWADEIQIAAIRDNPDGTRSVAKAVEMVDLPRGHVINDPTLRLGREEAQFLMDQLWDCGLRPTEGSGSAGSLAATQAHLQDMRRLVFDRAGLKAEQSTSPNA